MRLDKFLKVSRVIKRRTVACDMGRVMINGRTAKASTSVKSGDIVEIKFGEKIIKFQILRTDEIIKKEEASEMFKLLD